MVKKYYDLETIDREATINIYGDITSFPWDDSDVSAYNLSQELQNLDVDVINVRINSYGGEVAEGWAIYNALKQHKAKIHTFCDGFACSIASVIFMAGDIRTMGKPSALMIHNPWVSVTGNAEELKKEADNLEKMSEQTISVYKTGANLSEKELKDMLDEETYIFQDDAVKWGFATDIAENLDTENASQSAKISVFERLQNFIAPGAIKGVSEGDRKALKDAIKEIFADALMEQMEKSEKQEAEKSEEKAKYKQAFLNYFKSLKV